MLDYAGGCWDPVHDVRCLVVAVVVVCDMVHNLPNVLGSENANTVGRRGGQGVQGGQVGGSCLLRQCRVSRVCRYEGTQYGVSRYAGHAGSVGMQGTQGQSVCRA